MASNTYAFLYRFINTLLLAILVILAVSGVLMLYIDRLPWIYDLHRMVGFSLLFLVPWKGLIIFRSLRRGPGKTFDRSVVVFLSVLLAIFVVIVIVSGLLWMWRLGPHSLLLQSLISWHWILGLLLLPLAIFHVWRRWPKPRKSDFLTRRNFVKIIGAAVAGVITGEAANRLGVLRAEPESPRRFTGSQGVGDFMGNGFPVVGERIQFISAEQWRLVVRGTVNSHLSLTYADLLRRRLDQQISTLDCTNGWYSVQNWEGVRLIDLLDEARLLPGATGVRLISVTGYHHTYPIGEAQQILLATHVTGEVLEPRHGFPVRAVVPGRRGWFWVKWLGEVEVLEGPIEVLGGILASPWEVLRQWQ